MKKDSKKRILLIGLDSSSFVKDDILYLEDHFQVLPFYFKKGLKKGLFPLLFRWIRQFVWLIQYGYSAEVIYGWFADYHMLFPIIFSKMTGKPTIICLGGYDCSNVPVYKYGVFYDRWRNPIARFVLRNAKVLIPVTEKLVSSRNNYTLWPQEKDFGLFVHMPNLKTEITPIPTGYNPDNWSIGDNKRKRQVCTVAYIDTDRTFYIKGIDIFLETARLLPDVEFLIVGIPKSYQQKIKNLFQVSDNVQIIEPVERIELKTFYNESYAYLQLSRLEGLPNVLCEAMLSGCIPIGSNVFGIPEVIGETGYIVNKPLPEEIAKVVRKALESTDEMRIKARQRIINEFSAEKRKKTLLELIDRFVA